MNIIPHITIRAVLLFIFAATAVASSVPLTASGSISVDHFQQEEEKRLVVFNLDAPQLRVNSRDIFVYLPPDYFTSDKAYPVIYFHDGGMVFSTNGNHDSRFDLALDQLFADGETDGIIGVGVSSSENRWDELSPWENPNMDMWGVGNALQVEGGEGDAYLDFIINTVKPHIDGRYRTLPDRENTAIGGFSMGGFISIYAGLKHPDVFSKVMAMSPAVWFSEVERVWMADNRLINLIREEEVPHNVKFYIDIGTNEWSDMQPFFAEEGSQLTYPFVWVDGTDKVFNALETRKIPKENLLLVVEEGGTHYPFEWRERSYDALLWLFDGLEIPTAPEIVAIIPPEKAVIVKTPTLFASEEVDLSDSGIHVVGVNRFVRFFVLLAIGIALVILSLVLLRFLVKKKKKPG